eukprot:3401642-Rhodomonas_salina.2
MSQYQTGGTSVPMSQYHAVFPTGTDQAQQHAVFQTGGTSLPTSVPHSGHTVGNSSIRYVSTGNLVAAYAMSVPGMA